MPIQRIYQIDPFLHVPGAAGPWMIIALLEARQSAVIREILERARRDATDEDHQPDLPWAP